VPSIRGARRVVSRAWNHPSNHGQRLRSVATVLRFETRARLLHRPTVVRYGERSRLWVRRDGLGSRRAAHARLPDYAEMRTWQSRLRPGSLFIDVGAHVGLYTILALEAGAEVVAVEPQEIALRQLRANLALNGYRAEMVCAALADAPGRMALDGPDVSQHALVLGSVGDVEVTTLDALLGDRVAEVKIDVEGAERLVLEGASRALAERRLRCIQLEWNRKSESTLHETREPVAHLLRSYDYVLSRATAHGRLEPIADVAYGPDVFATPADLADNS
jgi:FkbM family methyltransferase